MPGYHVTEVSGLVNNWFANWRPVKEGDDIGPSTDPLFLQDAGPQGASQPQHKYNQGEPLNDRKPAAPASCGVRRNLVYGAARD